jgi:hypothetical protein
MSKRKELGDAQLGGDLAKRQGMLIPFKVFQVSIID